MAEQQSFDERMSAFADYYQHLEEIDPDLNKDLKMGLLCFTGLGRHLREARASVKFAAECTARGEYHSRNFSKKDLRTDTPEERRERAGVLAMVTAPQDPETFQDRAVQIEEMLERIVNGDEIRVAPHRYDGREFRDTQVVSVDIDRPIYLVFDNGHVSGRDVGIYYDRPGQWVDGHYEETERALHVLLPSMFDGVVTYPDAQVA